MTRAEIVVDLMHGPKDAERYRRAHAFKVLCWAGMVVLKDGQAHLTDEGRKLLK